MNSKALSLLAELVMIVLSFLKEKGVIDDFLKVIEKKVEDSESPIDDMVLKLIKLAL